MYADQGDLLPLCGVVPGPDDPRLGEAHLWHTGHDLMMLRAHHDIGGDCCMTCLEYAVTDGWACDARS